MCFGRVRKFFRMKIASTKFRNIQIEMLYQRYLLRMNQNNAAHIVWLLFALIFILSIIHINFLLTRWNNELSCGSAAQSNHSTNQNATGLDANFTDFGIDLNSNVSQELLNESRAVPLELETSCVDPVNTYELLGTNFIQFSLLGLCSILYTILLLCLYKQRINEIYLFHVSYAIIISLVIIDISFSITNMGKWVNFKARLRATNSIFLTQGITHRLAAAQWSASTSLIRCFPSAYKRPSSADFSSPSHISLY